MGEARSAHEEIRNAYKIFVGKPVGKRNSEEQDVDGRMMKEWILKE
jgi:hypothetical protein